MYKRRRIYEAAEKIIFEGVEHGTYVQFFKDNSGKTSPIADSIKADGKAVLHNRISEYIFTRLQEISIPTYFIKSLNMREQLVQIVEMIPLYLVCRNNISPELAHRFGLNAGLPLSRPLFEFFCADETLGNPIVSEEHILTFGWANEQDLEDMLALTTRINDFLCGLFAAVGLRLADFKLEFGRLWGNDTMQLVLAGEISPDSCSLWENSALNGKQFAKQPFMRPSPLDKRRRDQQSKKTETENENRSEQNQGDITKRFACLGHREVAFRLGLLNEIGSKDNAMRSS